MQLVNSNRASRKPPGLPTTTLPSSPVKVYDFNYTPSRRTEAKGGTGWGWELPMGSYEDTASNSGFKGNLKLLVAKADLRETRTAG